MIFWLDLGLFLLVIAAIWQWLYKTKPKKRVKNLQIIAILLVVDLVLLYLLQVGNVFVHAYRTLLFYSSTLVLLFFPWYGYQQNWLGAKKNSVSLGVLIGLGFLLFFIVSDKIVPLFYNLVKF